MIQKIDKVLQTVEIQIKFKLEKVDINMTGNKKDRGGNARIMSFGVES